MRLPGGDRAVVDIRKLRDYCLNENHLRGRHKARVFASALGMRAEHAADLRRILLAAATEAQASPLAKDHYGQRYVVECAISGPAGQGVLRSIWMVRLGEGFPRLLTCYLL